jgi:hypothetical protein
MRLPSLFTAAAIPLLLISCGGEDKPSYPVRTYAMGEKVALGRINYQVFETQWMTHLGEGADTRLPQQRFFLVRMTAGNSGSSDLIVPNLSIQDDNGKTYEELSDGTAVPEYIGYLRSVKPAGDVQGYALFDAPPRHYKLKIMDEEKEKIAYVDIPLSFGAETPDLVTPPEKKQ